MKAMVLCAGLGTRLRPYTDIMPKPLFPILGIPIIDWIILRLKKAEVKEIMVNLHHLPSMIVRHLGNGTRLGVNISYSDEPLIMGTGGGLSLVREFFRNEDFFILHNGDVFVEWELGEVISYHKGKKADATLCLVDTDEIDGARLVEIEGDEVIGIRGKPCEKGGKRYVFSGLSILSRSIFDFLPYGEACLIQDGIIPMIRYGLRIVCKVFSGGFFDIGTPKRYLETNLKLLKNCKSLFSEFILESPNEISQGVFIGENSKISESSKLTPPVLIYNNATVGRNAIVGPNVVVGGEALVHDNTTIQDAVVLKEFTISRSPQLT